MKHIKHIYLLLTALVLMSACSSSDEATTTLYGDAAITSFTLGTMNRYYNGKSSTYTGSSYSFKIDPVTHQIENTGVIGSKTEDDFWLPVGTIVKKVVCNITTKNNGMLTLKSLDGSGFGPYYATDSVDFSSPRIFRVTASDGSGYTDYTVTLNVHSTDGDAFVWKQMTSIPATMTALTTVCFDGKVCIFGNEGGQTKGYSTTDGTSWSALTLPALSSADAWQNVVAHQDSLYLMDGSTVFRTHELTTWEKDDSQTTDGNTLTRLIGASHGEIYGLAGSNKLMMKFVEVPFWLTEERDTVDMLPTNDLTTVTYPLNYSDSTDHVLLAGNRLMAETDASGNSVNVWRGVVWRKIADYSMNGILGIWRTTGELGGKWSFMERSNHTLELPALSSLQLLYYNDVVLALGGQGLQDTSIKACDNIYVSRDNGITWKKNTSYSMPPTDETSGNTFNSNATAVAATVDNDNFIWVISADTREVWRGRLNRLGWK